MISWVIWFGPVQIDPVREYDQIGSVREDDQIGPVREYDRTLGDWDLKA